MAIDAEPAQSVLAGLPNQVSPQNFAAFPEIEGAMDRAFDRMMRMTESEGDYGMFNFGDVQYEWTGDYEGKGHAPAYRYWLNHGKGWSPIPWLLYLRSGDRKYLERGKSYARHLMDVDTCHVTDDALRKYKGGQIGYGPIHFGSYTFPVGIQNESEYLGLYYHLTGYERAKDVIEERRIALTSPANKDETDSTQDMLTYLSAAYLPDWKVRFNREHYMAIGEIAAIYELTQRHPSWTSCRQSHCLDDTLITNTLEQIWSVREAWTSRMPSVLGCCERSANTGPATLASL